MPPHVALLIEWLVVDPWFNFRATKYLVKHGFYSFWDWFDDSTPRAAPPPRSLAPAQLIQARTMILIWAFCRDMAPIGPCYWRYSLSRPHGY